MQHIKIYMAGGMSGLSLDEQLKWRNAICNAIKYGDYEYTKQPDFFSPPEYYSPSTNEHKSEREVMEFELSHLRKSDLVVVNFNVPKSIGTAMELMIAKEHHIPVIGLNTDGTELHPWLLECTTRMCSDLREVVDHVVNFYLK